MESAKLTNLVRGELDWIVLKALEKDRNGRAEEHRRFREEAEEVLERKKQ